MSIFKIVIALLLFGVIIFVHELGHFLVAKACKIRVNEFALGMGPKLFSFGKGETTYSLRLLPFGGFCAMEGEDDASDDPKAFGNKKVWQRILVVVAGVLMNFILGYVVLLIGIGFFTPETEGRVLFPTTTIVELPEDSPAYESGLRPGDTIRRIDGRGVVTLNDAFLIMQTDEDGVMSMVVDREVDGKTQRQTLPNVTFDIVVEENGTRYLQYDIVWLGKPQTFLNTFTETAKTEWSLVTSVWGSLGDLISGKYGLNELSGPIGTVDIIGDMVGQAAQTVSRADIYNVFYLFALISVNVGVMNLLPIPALDGGRLVFLLFEAIFRRPVPQKFEGVVHFIGFALLMLLMVVIAFSDVFKLFNPM